MIGENHEPIHDLIDVDVVETSKRAHSIEN
jgi:hypothetical protein